MSERTLQLPDTFAAAILQAAARIYPNEACGLVEGADTEGGWRVTAIHESRNAAADPKRHFLIDPQMQFDLLHKLRGGETRIIGCFHSHPGGRAEPSATDRAEAYESGFVYLIAGGSADVFELKAYLFDEGSGFSAVAILSPD